jgi:RimJ/RimL family protein N-acetyltransferase
MTCNHYSIRQLRRADRPLLRDLLGRLSEDTRRKRFGSPAALQGARAEAEIDRLPSRHDHDLVLVAAAHSPRPGELLGLVEMRRYPDDPGAAEIGIVVRDDCQRKGVGTLLLRELCAQADRLGVDRLHFLLLAQNSGLRRLLSKLGPVATSYIGDGMLDLTLQVPARSA